MSVREITRAELRLLPYLAFTLMCEWRQAEFFPVLLEFGECLIKIVVTDGLPKFWLYEDEEVT